MRRSALLLLSVLLMSCRAMSAPPSTAASRTAKVTNQSIFDLFSAPPPPLVLPVDGADTKVPVIYFDEDVDDRTVKAAIDEIDKANKNKATAIVLELDSEGGSVSAGKKLSKAIERSKAPVHCVVDGDAMSMGYYILQSCNTRTMTDESTLMIHGVSLSGNFGGKDYQWRSIANFLTADDHAACVHEARRMALTADQLCEKVAYTEWYLEPDEALKVKAVDAVVQSVDEVSTALRAGKSWPRPIVEVQPAPKK
jgi:ATP-dependent protease ClpP protease subunit